MEFWIIVFGIAGIIVAWSYHSQYKDAIKERESANLKLNQLEDRLDQIINSREEAKRRFQTIEAEFKRLQKYEDDLNKLIAQRSKGFPLLGEVYQEYFDVQSKLMQGWLRNKKRPAPKSADVVRDITKEKREIIKQLKILEYKIKNYELIAPFLTEVEEVVSSEDDAWLLRDYSDEELEDEARKFLTIEEYRKLSPSERNQLALDRYWSKGRKSLWTIGKMYEHYIGYLYEQKGWDVEYFGIAERYEDFGRDLIARKGNICHIVQCKNWSKYKTIYENHIFQLFGTTFEYQKQFSNLEVLAVFYTSTTLSEAAEEFAKRLGLEIHDNTKLERYPCIKCNINRKDGTKIYHLPFDLSYDVAKIEPKRGEFYCETVAEAEKGGFRRAYRWHGANRN